MENRWQGVLLYTLPTRWTQAMQMCPPAPISGSNAHAVFLLTYNVVWIGATPQVMSAVPYKPCTMPDPPVWRMRVPTGMYWLTQSCASRTMGARNFRNKAT